MQAKVPVQAVKAEPQASSWVVGPGQVARAVFA